MKVRISVIIPVFNKEDCIRKTIESVLNQSYENLQIILVDDGSADSSFSICREYEKRDNRVLALHQENKGVSAARNKGIDAADGEWISFIDCGDYIEPSYYEKAVANMLDDSLDVICTTVYKVQSNGKYQRETRQAEKRVLSREAAMRMMLNREWMTIAVYDKIYKRKISARFDETITHNEDALFCYEMLKGSNRILLDSDIRYYYTYDENSVSRMKFSKKQMSIVRAQNQIFEDICRNYSQLYPDAIKNYMQSLLMCLSLAIKSGYEEVSDIKMIQRKIRKVVVEYLKTSATRGYKILAIVSSLSLRWFKWMNK